MNFIDKLQKAIAQNNSLLCVGLDPDAKKINSPIFEFNKKIINETANLVCAYKLNIAFYAASGINGLEELVKTINYLIEKYPDIVVICDAKRGDVESTAELYARELFDFLKVDAATINPYLGFDSIEPYLMRKEKGIIILCRTSNPGAVDFQDLKVAANPLYIKIAQKVSAWSKKYPNILMVVGATWPKELKKIRAIAPRMFFLIPGIGAQGGDVKNTLKFGLRADSSGLIISASRSIIYDQDPKAAAQILRDEINKYR